MKIFKGTYQELYTEHGVDRSPVLNHLGSFLVVPPSPVLLCEALLELVPLAAGLGPD